MVETNLGLLHVRRTGAAPALLWQSLFVDSGTVARGVEDLSQELELIIVDVPGHGGRPGPRGFYSLVDCAKAAVQVLDALDIKGSVDWVGNAWAGTKGSFSRTASRPYAGR